MPVADLIRQVGIFGTDVLPLEEAGTWGCSPDQVRELKQLQEENGRLKKLVAELSLDKAILQDVASKSGPARAETCLPNLHTGRAFQALPRLANAEN